MYQLQRIAVTLLPLLAAFACGCGDDKDAGGSSGTTAAGAAAVSPPAPPAPLQPSRYLSGHADGVRSVAFSPDGKWVLTASQDGTARIWDAASTKELRRLEGHAGALTAAALSVDGERVATCGIDTNVMVWDAGSGELLAILEGHEYMVMDVAFAPDGSVVSAGQDGSIRRWDVEEERSVWATGRDSRVATCLAVSPDGTLLASGSTGGVIMVRELDTGRPLWREKMVRSPEEEGALMARQKRNAEAGRPLSAGAGEPAADPGSVAHVVFSPDGSRLYGQRLSGAVQEWEPKTGRYARYIELEGYSLASDVSPDGRWLFVASNEALRVWNVEGERAELVATLAAEGHNAAVDVAFAPDGRTVALARGGGWGAGMSLASTGETRVPLWDLSAFNPGTATRTAEAMATRPAATSPAGD